MPRKRYTPEQKQAVIDDYRTWQDTGQGEVQDIWDRHGISKEWGYTLVRQAGLRPGRPEKFDGKVPMEVVQLMLETMRVQIEDYRNRIRELEAEVDKLRRRPRG